MKFRISISRVFLSYMIMAAVLPLIIAGIFTISRTYNNFEKESKQIHEKYIDTQKTMLKYEVGKIVFYIRNLSDHTHEYETFEDQKRIQDKVISDIISMRFGEDGYFFGSTLEGDPLFSNGKITKGSDNILDLTDPYGVKIIQSQKEAAQNPNGGFIEYFWPKLNNEELFPKLSFTMSIPEWEWMIGAGVYVDEIDKVIAEKKVSLKKQMKIDILSVGFVFIIILLFLTIIAKHFSVKIRNNFEIFLLFFKKSETESIPINIDNFHFPEFKTLALSANRMIELREEAEKSLKESEKKFRSYIENSPFGIFVADEKGNYVDVNKTACKITGYSKAELLSKNLIELTLPKDYPIAKKHFETVVKTGISTGDLTFIKKDGSKNTWTVNAVKLSDNRFLGFVIDITKQKIMEETIKESEERFRSLSNATFEAIFISERGICLEQNSTAEKMFGYTLSEAIGKKGTEWIAHEDREMVMNNIISGYEEPYEAIALRKDGSTFPVEIQGKIMHYKEKTVRVTALSDITERKKAEKALRESEIKYRTIFESFQDIYYRTDNKGIIIEISPSVFQISGFEPKELIGKPVTDVYEDHGERINLLKAFKKSGKVTNYELKLLTKDNKIKIGSLNSQVVAGQDGAIKGIEGIIRDITERKKEGEIQKVLYNISHVLNTAENIQELYVKIRESLGSIIDTTNFYIALYDEKNDLISLPFDIDEKDNYEVFPAGKTVTKYVINSGKPLLADKDVIRELTRKGLIEIIGASAEVWLGVPLKVENKVIGVIVVQSYEDSNLFSEKDIEILTFISEEIALAIKHKQAEEELKINRGRLKIANSILRHDIANDLIVIKSAIRLFKVKQDMKMFDEINIRIEKSLNTIQKQRDYELFMDSHATLSEYDLEKVAHDCIKNYPDIEININGKGKVYADNAIYSVFENIISNAIRHGKTSKLNIDISSDKEFCEIRFTDYGIGIPDDLKYKIFSEGFHHGETGNTGIGLYIVQQTIDDYDGRIFVEDNEPNGAVFVIKLREGVLK